MLCQVTEREHSERRSKMDGKAIGSRLKELREKENMRQDELAKAIGVSFSAYSKYEIGERIPRDEIKVRIAEFYKKTVQSIFYA